MHNRDQSVHHVCAERLLTYAQRAKCKVVSVKVGDT